MRYKVIGIEHFANKIGQPARAGDMVGLLIVPVEETIVPIDNETPKIDEDDTVEVRHGRGNGLENR